ncbi:MAG: carboxypeptidase regulatory-like domain-containing protein [Candidatus Sericytochromatia bacterium]
MRTKQRGLVLLAVGLLVVLLIVWSWWHRDARISGQIRDAQGQGAIKNAELKLNGEPWRALPQSQEHFVLNPVKPGVHTLSVRAVGYLPQQHKISLKAGQHFKLTVQLDTRTPDKRVQGSVLLVGTHSPPAMQVYSAERQHLLEIKLLSKPLAAVLSENQIFVLTTGKDEVQRYDIQTGKALPSIPLPHLSGPQRLIVTPGGKWVLVLNVVARNLTVIERASQKIHSVIPLPISATDMGLLPDGSTAIVAGEEGLARVFFLNHYVDKPIPVVFRPDSGLVILPKSGKVLLPNRDWISEVDLASGTFQEWELPFNVEQIAVIDESRLFLAGEKFGVYHLYQKQLQDEALVQDTEPLQALYSFQGQILCATRNPARWYPCWPYTSQAPESQPLKGEADFILSAHVL